MQAHRPPCVTLARQDSKPRSLVLTRGRHVCSLFPFPTHMYTRLLHLRHASIDTKASTLVPGIVNNNIFASSRPYPRRKEHVFAGVSTPSTTPTPGALAYIAH